MNDMTLEASQAKDELHHVLVPLACWSSPVVSMSCVGETSEDDQARLIQGHEYERRRSGVEAFS